jgi:hypothetical protein
MHNRHDNDMWILNTIENSEREAMHQCAPRISVHDRVNEWLLRDESKCGERFVQELVPQSDSLLFVP